MLGIAASVSLVVYHQWQPGSAQTQASETRPGLAIGESGDERAAESLTSGLDFHKSDQEGLVFRIRAREHVDFADGWNEWSFPVVLLAGRDEGNDVTLTGERMRTSGAMENPDDVRLLGDVVATLPRQGTFTSNRIDFDAITGLVSTCRRGTLVYAGLDVRSACLEFQTAGDVTRGDGVVPETLRMWDDLSIRSAEQESGLPAGLGGSAQEMQFRPGGDRVKLLGEPKLEFSGTWIRGDFMELDMNLESHELRTIETSGNARLRYYPTTSEPMPGGTEPDPTDLAAPSVPSSDAADELADDGATPLILRADRLHIALGGDARIGEVIAVSESGEAARLALGEHGRLTADEILLQPGDEAQEITASGSVTWHGDPTAGSLGDLSAASLSIRVLDGSLERLEANGQVVAELPSGDTSAEFRGRQLVLEWSEEGLSSGEWPEGVRINTDGRRTVASSATYEPEIGVWLLAGAPPPSVSDEAMHMSAASMEVGGESGLQASDGVEVRLGGALLAAAGPLFGTATLIDVKAGEATISPLGVLTLESRVEIAWEEQSLVAGKLRLETDPGRLHASGKVEMVAVSKAQPEERAAQEVRGDITPEGSEESTVSSRFITVSAQDMLVEEQSADIRLAGVAKLRHGARSIGASILVVQLDGAGAWSTIQARDEVQFRDAEASATGEAMTYDLETGELLLEGSELQPATFLYNGIQYNSGEALRVRFEDGEVQIETTQDGRTQTRVVPRQQLDYK